MAGSATQCDHSGSSDRTPLLSPNTIWKLDEGNFDDHPLSDHPDFEPSDKDQEMISTDEQLRTKAGDGGVMGAGPMDAKMGGNNTGCNPGNPKETRDPVLGPTAPDTGTLALAVEVQALTSPALAIAMARYKKPQPPVIPLGLMTRRSDLTPTRVLCRASMQ